MHVALAAILLSLALFVSPACAGDGVQILPDGTRILVSKDVGDERWAITLDLGDETPLNVTGNVFRRDGGPASFLWCPLVDVSGGASDIRNATFIWDCFGADRCAAPPCGADKWKFISRVSLQGRFFLP